MPPALAGRTSPPFASLRDPDTDFGFGATRVDEVHDLFVASAGDTAERWAASAGRDPGRARQALTPS
ncbi:hypothetical protein OG920_07065 [Streptomyces europaeiscabiei]|uniref:hypothetical protein n=2 Tax=Streptomyces europaeiscabiei TaxID=146819 RepID=UPI0029A50944|nr:hypothetical protein [Streptomyces europaeiscabiei]MDX3582045.1 hypothetical protein [Streptomyces europaeiscabiei]MDX3634758.1 hypothetical protein [Streptomyces europaeiscabiei]MDX3652714.1 hypothetical protein [Streptomyces europaeiscabiei]WUD31225.1 hypothetical protein OG858_07280 [Streptomyces europaeiscabiei]